MTGPGLTKAPVAETSVAVLIAIVAQLRQEIRERDEKIAELVAMIERAVGP